MKTMAQIRATAKMLRPDPPDPDLDKWHMPWDVKPPTSAEKRARARRLAEERWNKRFILTHTDRKPIILRVRAPRQFRYGDRFEMEGAKFVVTGVNDSVIRVWPWRPSPLRRRLP